MADAAHGGHGRRTKNKDWEGPEAIPFTIPLENNLARVHLEKLDMFAELKRVTRHVDSRHHSVISGEMVRPATPKKSGGPFGSAKLPSKRTNSLPSTLQRLESSSQPQLQSEAVAVPKKKPGLSKDFVLPSNDPMAYPNPHEFRGDCVKRAIGDQQKKLEAARTQSLSRRSMPNLHEQELQVFRWDHVPVAFDTSEYQAQHFPRSIQANRMCGGGKDPSHTRPWQDYEKWREKKFFQEGAMGKSKV